MEKYGYYTFCLLRDMGYTYSRECGKQKSVSRTRFLKLSNASDVNREKIVVNHEIVKVGHQMFNCFKELDVQIKYLVLSQ